MQELIVGAIVAGAGCYLTLRYMPKAVLGAAGNALIRAARAAGATRFASRLEKSLETAKCASACGSCGGCGGKDSDAKSRNGTTAEALKRTAQR
jgi:hypothetical protein